MIAKLRASQRARSIAARLRGWSPAARQRKQEEAHARAAFEAQLAALAVTNRAAAFGAGSILVDGTFDNPNYWLRYALLRAAGGITPDREIGLIGPWRRDEATATFQRLGITNIVDGMVDSKPFKSAARRLAVATHTAADVLCWQLPFDFPATFLYDGLLKRQRAATVNVRHPAFVDDVAEALADIDFADQLTRSQPWSAFILSHAVNFRYAALAWVAARRGIPVLVAFGNYGTPRYWRMDVPAQIVDSVDRPSGVELDRLPHDDAVRLEASGRAYLKTRLGGHTTDIGSIYAFQRNRVELDRPTIADTLGWPTARPIVTVYASNWFDFPHAAGLSLYRDFLEWIEVTLAAAFENTRVSWLFRAHPCDEWYGGLTLADVMPANPPEHVQLCPTPWHGAAVLHASDAVVTVHGTVGIEAAMLERPVLLADAGWYHDCGFAVWPRTVDEYRSRLRDGWTDTIDTRTASRRAAMFAGIYFGLPAWQAPFISGDDSEQAALYPTLTALLSARPPAVDREIEMIAEWLASKRQLYHTFKMQHDIERRVG